MFAPLQRSLQGLICATLVAAAGSNAALVTVAGDDLTFTYDDSTLYGVATVVGNSITFNPTGFQALALNGGVDFENETLNIEIRVKAGSGFMIGGVGVGVGVGVREAGDYKLLGVGS